MAWLILGALLLLVAVRGGGGKAARPDGLAMAALACLAAAAWWSLRVYAPTRAAPMLLAVPLGLVLALLPRRGWAPPFAARCAALALGAAASLFALFGPADGLF